MRRMVLIAWLAGWLLAVGGQAQVRPVTSPRPVPQTGGDTLTVSVSTSALSFTLLPKGIAYASSVPTLSTSFSFAATRSLSLYGYFASASAALSGGSPTVTIPSSAVSTVTASSGQSFVAFTQSSPFNAANSSVAYLLNYSATGTGTLSGGMYLAINLAGLPQLPAATYSGVLYIQAQAF